MTNPIEVNLIKPNPYQARLSDDAAHIQSIADSIATDKET